MLNAKDTVSDQRIEEIKKMIWEIFDTYKDGSSIARQYQLFQDMKDLNVEILANNNQFRMENITLALYKPTEHLVDLLPLGWRVHDYLALLKDCWVDGRHTRHLLLPPLSFCSLPPLFSLFSHWEFGNPPPRRKPNVMSGNRDDLDEDVNDVDGDVAECYTDAYDDDVGGI